MNQRTYPSAAQKARLVQYLETDAELSEGKYSSRFSKEEAKERWIDIAEDLNSIPGVIKTWVEWRKTWQDIKCSIKKKSVLLQKAQIANKNTKSRNLRTKRDGDEYQDTLTTGQPINVPVITVRTANILEINPLIQHPEVPQISPLARLNKDFSVQKVTPSLNTAQIGKRNDVTYSKAKLTNKMYSYEYFNRDYVCRLCWTYNNETMGFIDTTIAAKILATLEVDVTKLMPNKVCASCREKVETFSDFKEACQEADIELKIILEKGPSKDNIRKYIFKVEIEENDSIIVGNEDTLTQQDQKEERNDLSDIEQDSKCITSNNSKIKEQENNELSDFEEDKNELSDCEQYSNSISSDTNLNEREKNELSDIQTNDSNLDATISKEYELKTPPKINQNSTTPSDIKEQDNNKNDCHTCQLNFDSTAEHTKHNLQYHQRTYKCIKCKEIFANFTLKRKHEIEKCKATTKYRCEKCGKYLESALKLETHKNVHFSYNGNISCKKCAKSFNALEDLRKHMYSHRTVKNCICEICGRVFNNKKHLVQHTLIHTSHKKLECPHCDYRATQPISLKYHIRLHTGERPYACDLCPYRAVHGSNLKKHVKSHQGVKDFKCLACGKAYAEKQSLSDHIISAHEGVKKYACKRCSMQYSRMENLRKHMKTVHGKCIRKVKNDIIEVPHGTYMRINRSKVKFGTDGDQDEAS